MTDIIGWDIGGAHLKAARLSGGRITHALQVPCPLWQGMDHLERAFGEILQSFPAAGHHAVTMTGELADLFRSRADGVKRIAHCARAALAGDIAVYTTGRSGFVPPTRVARHVEDIAAANWHATASICARRWRNGLLVDIGSTTTDVIAFANGQVSALGYDDTVRLQSGELVYTGVVRTPVMAMARTADYLGASIPLMAEHFATAADVYRLTGELAKAADQSASADGRGKTLAASAARLARMIGRNGGDSGMDTWRALAASIRASQIGAIAQAVERVAKRARLGSGAPLVAAGVGAFAVRAIGAGLGRAVEDIASAVPSRQSMKTKVSQCAPAAAVAMLRQDLLSA